MPRNSGSQIQYLRNNARNTANEIQRLLEGTAIDPPFEEELQQIHQMLSGFISEFDSNSRLYPTITSSYLDSLVGVVAKIEKMLPPEGELPGAKNSDLQVRGWFKSEIEELGTLLRQWPNRQYSLELQNLRVELQNKIDTLEKNKQSLGVLSSRYEKEIPALIERLDKLAINQAESFMESQKKRSNDWQDLQKETENRLHQYLNTMQLHVDESREALSKIGTNLTTGNYTKYANDQSAIADKWRIAGVFALSVAALVFLIPAILPIFNVYTDLNWTQFIFQRIGAPAGIAALGYVLLREATQHRKEERASRQVQLTLAALEPFIANLPVDQQRQIRTETARIIFGGGTSEVAKISRTPAISPDGTDAGGQ